MSLTVLIRALAERRCLAALAATLLLAAALPASAPAAKPASAPAAKPASAPAANRTPPSSYPAENSHPRSGRATARAAASSSASSRGKRKKKPRGPVLHGNAFRAYLAYQAMQRYYYISGSGLYAGEPFSYLWPFSTALAATVSLAHVPALAHTLRKELNARLIGLQSYLDTDNAG